MATKMVQSKVIVCDKTGVEMSEEDANRREIEWGGKTWTLDLCDDAAAEYDKAHDAYETARAGKETWVDIATPAKRTRAAPASPSASAEPTVDLAAVRKWAADQTPPVELKGRGRIPKAIVAAYEASLPAVA